MMYIQNMKAETAKQNKRKASAIKVDLRLDEFFNGKVLFPEKLAQANEFLRKHSSPDDSRKQKG